MNYTVAESLDKQAPPEPWLSPNRLPGLRQLGRRLVGVLGDWSARRLNGDELPSQPRYGHREAETGAGARDWDRVGDESLDIRRFRLIPYFLCTAVAAIIAVTGSAGLFFVRSTEAELSQLSLDRGAKEAEHVAQIFYYTVWAPVHMEFPDFSFRKTVHPKMMDVFARRSTYGLNVVKLNVWDLDGSLLWGSDPAHPYGRAVGDWHDTVVNQGKPFSEFLADHQVTDLDGEERTLHAVRTYYALRDSAPDAAQAGNVVGVLEVTQDVNDAVAGARSDMTRSVVLGSIGAGLLLSTLLFLIVLKVNRKVARGYQELLHQREALRDAHERRAHSTKLAGIGELVASVAHELNNPLTSIWGLTQILTDRDDNGLDPKLKRELSMIHRETERSVRIVQNLLSFSRAEGAQKAYTSINSAIEAALELRRYHLMVNNIHLQVDLQPDLPRTMADPHKIQQVILNLIINAEQAMLEANGRGKLGITCEEAAQYIRIVVSDDGPGVPEENLNKVFDPFFTTKTTGTGTGLGLSICHSIIQEHSGSIRVVSEPGTGTKFIIELPILGAEALPEQPATSTR